MVEIKTIEYDTAKDFLLPRHYSGRTPSVSYAYGCYNNKELVGGVSADDLLNDSVPSFRVSFINAVIKKQEVDLLYYCRCQLVDIITMIDVANTADDLNLELLKVLVGDIKNVFGGKKSYETDR